MSMLVRFTPTSGATTEQYDETIRRLEQAGDFPPDGLQLHVAFTADDGNIRVSEIWDSQEQFESFGRRLMPILTDVGIDPGQPEILQIHNVVDR